MHRYSFWKPHIHLIRYLGRKKRGGPGPLFLSPLAVVWEPHVCLMHPEWPWPAQASAGHEARESSSFQKATPETGSCFLSFPFWASISFFVLKSIPRLQPSPSPALSSPRLKTHPQTSAFLLDCFLPTIRVRRFLADPGWVCPWRQANWPAQGQEKAECEDSRHPDLSRHVFLLLLGGLSEICL